MHLSTKGFNLNWSDDKVHLVKVILFKEEERDENR